VKGLTELGNQNFGAERYTEAADAYGESVDLLEDISGEDANGLDVVLRTAGVMHAHALLADRDYAGAANALTTGLAYMPELPHRPFDLKKVFRPQKLDLVVADLEAAAAKPGASADVVFLLGYVYHCIGKAEQARAQFKKAAGIDPAHKGAQRFLKD
jgi:tetratricopeptide (TPR) repeat protein